MNLQQDSSELNPRYEECLRLHDCWLWFLLLGIGLVVVGVLAIGAALITTLTSVLVFGILLICGGVVQIVNAFLARTWKAFFLHLLAGALHLVVGGLMVEHPLKAAESLTFLLAVAFLVGGAMRLVGAAIQSFPGREWVLVNGFVTFLLGISIWRQWPESSLWVIGLFIGIDLLFNDWTWVMLGLTVRIAGRGVAVTKPQAPSAVVSASH